jgi:hypothetical protein
VNQVGRRRVLLIALAVVLVVGGVAYVALGGAMPAVGPWRYVASQSSDKYHDPSCVWADQIRSRRYFSSKKSAEAAGCMPCPLCVDDTN